MHMRRIFILLALIPALLFAAASLPAGAGGRAPQSSGDSAPAKPKDGAQQFTQEPAPPRQEQGKITQTVNLVDPLFTVLSRPNKLGPDLQKDAPTIWGCKGPQALP